MIRVSSKALVIPFMIIKVKPLSVTVVFSATAFENLTFTQYDNHEHPNISILRGDFSCVGSGWCPNLVQGLLIEASLCNLSVSSCFVFRVFRHLILSLANFYFMITSPAWPTYLVHPDSGCRFSLTTETYAMDRFDH
jgi:hypothetical protein